MTPSTFITGIVALVALAVTALGLIAVFRPLPRAKLPTRRRGVLALAGGLVLMVLVGKVAPATPTRTAEELGSVTSDAVGKPDPAQSAKPTGPTTAAESEARAYAKRVKVTLDATMFEGLMVQMPDNIQPQSARSGVIRTFTWMFGDGSQIVATFRPKGGEGSKQGLLLYKVDIKP